MSDIEEWFYTKKFCLKCNEELDNVSLHYFIHHKKEFNEKYEK